MGRYKKNLAPNGKPSNELKNINNGSLFKGESWEYLINKVPDYFLKSFNKPILLVSESSVLSLNFSKYYGEEDIELFLNDYKQYPNATVYINVNNNKNKLPKFASDYLYDVLLQLQKGISIEQEHKETLEKVQSGEISVDEAIKETAVEHIKENPNYYSELEKIENKQTREEFYYGVNIGLRDIMYQYEKEVLGNGATFSYKPFKVNNVQYIAIRREPKGWSGRLGADYEIKDPMGYDVSGFYNKVKKQYTSIPNNPKNLKELIEKFTTIAENEDIEVKDAYFFEQKELENKQNPETTQYSNVDKPLVNYYLSTSEHAMEYGFNAEKPVYVQQFFIPEADRRKGKGTEILAEIDKFAKDNNADLIFGYVSDNADKQNTLEFLNKAGFTIQPNGDFHKVVSVEKKEKKEDMNTKIALNKTDNWNQIPNVWKNIPPTQKVKFTNSPYDKGLQSIVKDLASKDTLRLAMSGINFDEKGITVTDAHVLLSLPYPNKDYNGVYSVLTPKSPNVILIDEKYPQYENVIRDSSSSPYVSEITIDKLKQYTLVAKKFANQNFPQVKYKYEGGIIGFNTENLVKVLDAFLELGYKKVYCFLETPNRPMIISTNKHYVIGKDEVGLVMPTIIHNSDSYGAEDIELSREITVYYDLQNDNIVNKDGSIAEYKENYGGEGGIDKEYIAMIKQVVGKNKALSILDYANVSNGVLTATDLHNFIEIRNLGIKDGTYELIDNALVHIDEVNDDFPSWKHGSYKIDEVNELNINSGAFAYYFEKCTVFASTDDLRPAMQGVFLQKENDTINMVSTNGNGLIKFDITKYCTTNASDFKYIISPEFIKKAVGYFPDEENLKLSFNEKYSIIKQGEVSIYTRLVDERYPDYKAVIPSQMNNLLKLNIKQLYNCLKDKTAESFLKRNKDSNIIGVPNGNVLNVLLSYGEGKGRGDDYKYEIIEEIEICQIPFHLLQGEYYAEKDLVLVMPTMSDKRDILFSFRAVFFKNYLLNTNNCEDIQLKYSQTNRAYLSDGDCLSYDLTVKPSKNNRVKVEVKNKEVVVDNKKEATSTVPKRSKVDYQDRIELLEEMRLVAKDKKTKQDLLDRIELIMEMMESL